MQIADHKGNVTKLNNLLILHGFSPGYPRFFIRLKLKGKLEFLVFENIDRKSGRGDLRFFAYPPCMKSGI